MADFSTIETKIRRITKSPSESQLTSDQIKDYVNDFILNDMPERLRVINLVKSFTFYTQPNIDTYTTDSTPELADFKQHNITVNAPFYVAGSPASFTQNVAQFNNLWPAVTTQTIIKGANGILVNFTGTLSTFPILRNQVLFTATKVDNTGLKLTDDGNGNLVGDLGAPSTINYLTGAYNITFSFAPKAGTYIYAQVYPYVANKPSSVLFHQDTFTLRPVPDRIYAVTFQVQCRPTDIWTLSTDEPMLQENWKYIAYGAAREICLDRGDMENLQQIEPRFQELELLAGRRTEVQQMDQRAPTIFSNSIVKSFSPFGEY